MEVFRSVLKYDNIQSNLSHKVQRCKYHTDNVYPYAFSRVCLYDHRLFKHFVHFFLLLLLEPEMGNDVQ